jgi:hypothetical protein
LARIGGDVKQTKFQIFFSQKLVRSGKSSKYEENEYKSSLFCLRQKPIGALNSTRIGRVLGPKNFKKFSSKIGEVWKELKI